MTATNYQNKSKEELIQELEALKLENNSLKILSEKKVTETAQSNEKVAELSWMIEHAGDAAIYRGNYRTLQYEYWSPNVVNVLGYSIQEIFAMGQQGAIKLIDSDDLIRLNILLGNLMAKGGGPYCIEYRFKAKDGKIRNIIEDGHAFVDEKNIPLYAIGSIRNITESKRIENELKESKNLFSLFMQFSPVYVFIKEVTPTESRVITASNNFVEMIGIPSNQMIGKTMHELFPAEFADKITSDDWKVVKNGVVLQLEENLNNRSYTTIKFPIVQNNKTLLAGYTIDVTERKQTEKMFQDIIDKNPLSIQILNMEGYTLQVNAAFLAIFGAMPPSNYSVLNDTQLLQQGFEEAFDKMKQGEVVNFPDSYYNAHAVDPSIPDNPLWLKGVGFTLNDNAGKADKIVFMHENITEQKHAEEKLIESEERFKALHNASFGGIGIHDKGVILECNQGLAEMTGYSLYELIGMDGLLLIAPDYRDFVMNKIITNFEKPYEAFGLRKNGEVYPIRLEARSVPFKGKKVRTVEFRDITEQKKAELELIKAKERAEESDRLKSAFLANMSHEIRTPMNGILGFADLLKKPELTGNQQQEFIKIIEKSGLRMLNIINDIIDISKIEAGQMKLDLNDSNINEQIEYIYTFFKPEVEANGLKISFKNTLTSNESIIKTDREKVYAILTNLVKNAIKYTEKGSIEFGYDVVVDTMHASYLQLQFYVKDTGIGIPENRYEAIFERFIQADVVDQMARQGAGLGLSITKAYVEMLGGQIWVKSEFGKGSVFYFTLPYKDKSIDKPKIENAISFDNLDNTVPAKLSGLKILIAEDDETSELLITYMIEKHCKELLKVRTGIEAVEVCRKNPDIDLIMMDIQMPELSGYAATSQIRRFNKTAIIIAQTAYGLSADREKAIEAGCDDYISKPISNKVLKDLIQKYFNK